MRAGRALNDEERKLLQKNVLDELVRERLWLADARRRGMKATDAAIDSRMKQGDFFKTQGQVDEAKFQAFKQSPSSNYPLLRAQVERTLCLEEYSRWMERRFGPREAEVQKMFEERTSQASIRYVVVGPDLVSLEEQATPAQIRAYYDSHPGEFETPDEAHIQYVRVTAASEGAVSESTREAAIQEAMRGAVDVLSAVRAGAPPEAAAKPHGGLRDTGWFRLGEPVRGLGRSESLTTAVHATKAGEWLKEPVRVGPHIVIARVVEKRKARRLPFREVVTQAKRKADAALRDDAVDSLAREEVRLHPETYAVPRVGATILARSLGSFNPGRAPSKKDVEKRLDRLRRRMNVSDTATAWKDSVRAAIPNQVRQERRLEAAFRTMRDAASRLARREDPTRVAARSGASASGFTLYRGGPPVAPLLVEGPLLDSLYTLRAGAVVGPRVKGDSVFVVRVELLDPSFLPPYEAISAAARTAALERRRERVVSESEAYFREHRGEYKTPTRWVLDYVFFRKIKPEEVSIHADSIAAYWNANPLEFTEPARARVRHILVALRAGEGATAREAARQKALGARKRVLDGEDFASVARELSEDAESAASGGELGELTRGTVMKEFGDAAFTIPIGEVSDLVETRLGFHILQVEERRPERLRPLEECREEIRGVLGGAVADSLARGAATLFAAAAAKEGSSFDSLAHRHGGAVRSQPVAASEPLAGVGKVTWPEKALSSLPDGGVTPQPIALPDGYLVVRRISEVAPAAASFEQVKERVVADYQAQRRRALAEALETSIREALRAGADPESVFVGLGGLRVSRQFGRRGPIPDLLRDPALARDSTYLETIFASKPGTLLPPLRGSSGTLYAVVDTVSVLPPQEFAKHRDTLFREVIEERVNAWTDRLRSKAPIRIHRKELRALLG